MSPNTRQRDPNLTAGCPQTSNTKSSQDVMKERLVNTRSSSPPSPRTGIRAKMATSDLYDGAFNELPVGGLTHLGTVDGWRAGGVKTSILIRRDLCSCPRPCSFGHCIASFTLTHDFV
ncbi:hypothetical protein BaRGS_00003367 [Batillaria attramentaria]|uniref:Uncharacterized protein n=1 Tax=Batillaria attramentaria TaxID=370345 RepID=A0ABD0M009_9CAEN